MGSFHTVGYFASAGRVRCRIPEPQLKLTERIARLCVGGCEWYHLRITNLAGLPIGVSGQKAAATQQFNCLGLAASVCQCWAYWKEFHAAWRCRTGCGIGKRMLALGSPLVQKPQGKANEQSCAGVKAQKAHAHVQMRTTGPPPTQTCIACSCGYICT